MIAKDLRSNSLSELEDKLANLVRELVTVRMQKAMSENKQTHLQRKLKRDIARIKTVYNEIKQGSADE
jgi:large subunit ribosomal protein L29